MADQLIEKIIATAKKEIGYLEKASNNQLDDKTANAGDKNWTKYARDLDSMNYFNGPKNSYAWCATFVNWVLVQVLGKETTLQITGQPSRNSGGASCSQAVNYYKKIGRFYTTNPQPGDQIFFSNDGGKTHCHTGLVTAVTKDRVYTIEGNTSSTTGVVANGGAVRDKSYLLTYSRISGYGRPKYELVKEEEEVTQEQFNKMMETWLTAKSVQPATFENDAIDWASKNGILQGNSQGQFMPKKPITRGEVVVVLKRFYDKFIKK